MKGLKNRDLGIPHCSACGKEFKVGEMYEVKAQGGTTRALVRKKCAKDLTKRLPDIIVARL